MMNKMLGRVVLGCAVGACGFAAQARTVALWPLEWDVQNQARDGRCAISADNNLSFDSNLVCEYVTNAGWGWTLPPNPDTTENMLFTPVNGTALYSYGTYEAVNYAYSTTVGNHLTADKDYTLEGWFRFPTLPASGSKFFIADCDGIHNAGNQRWFLTFRNGGMTNNVPLVGYTWQIFNSALGTGDTVLYTLSNEDVANIQKGWHHWAITFNHRDDAGKAVFKFYQDGRLLATRKWNAFTGTVNNSGFFSLGCRNNLHDAFTGFIDYCRLSDTVLEPSQFLNAGAASTSTVAAWKLDARNGLVSGAPSVGTARLYAGMFTNPWLQRYDSTKMRPDIDCAFTDNPPNPYVELPNGNVGSMFAGVESISTTMRMNGLGNDLYFGNDFTVEGWIKIERHLDTAYDSNWHHICGTRLCPSNTMLQGWCLQYKGARNTAKLYLHVQDNTGAFFANPPEIGSLAGLEEKWIHLALVYDHAAGNAQQGVWKTYIDGVQAGCVTNAVKPRDTNAFPDFKLGCLMSNTNPNMAPAPFTMIGKFDCWRVSKAALRPAQLMCTPNGEAATDVLALWPLNAQNGIHLDGTDIVTGKYTFESPREAKYLVTAASDAPDVPGVSSVSNGACAFRVNGSGSSSYLICHDGTVNDLFSPNNTDGWTMEWYVKRSEAPVSGNNEFVFFACDPSPRLTTNPTLRMNLNYRPTGFYLNVSGVIASDAQFKDAQGNPSTISEGEWTHLALTYQPEGTSRTYKLYINGIERGTVSGTGTPVAPSAIQFGGRNSTENSWRGAMSSIRISKGVLDPANFLCARTRNKTTHAFWPLESVDGALDVGTRVASAEGPLNLTKTQGVTGSDERARASVPRPDETPDFTGSRSANVGSIVLAANGSAESFNGGWFVGLDGAFTAEGWLKWQGGDGVVCGTYMNAAKGGWKLVMDASGAVPQLCVYVKGNGPRAVLADGVLLADASDFLNAWHHIAVRYDPAPGRGVWSLLVDGVACGRVENLFMPDASDYAQNAFRLGASSGDVACAGGYDLWRLSAATLEKDELLFAQPRGTMIIMR